MSGIFLWRQISRGIRGLARPAEADRNVADEVKHYLSEATAAYEAQGYSAEQARRAALADLGSVTAAREQVRASGWENTVGRLIADARYGARRLRSNPGFTGVSVLTLALGIGASTAIFSALDPVLFQPLPYPEPSSIASISDFGPGGTRAQVTFGTFRELSERSRSFDGLAVVQVWQPALTEADRAERLDGQRVTRDFFRVLGVQPVLGRTFLPSEDRPDGPHVVILSDALWRRRFGPDRHVIGKQIVLDAAPFTVVGVMPATFDDVLAESSSVWTPLQYDMSTNLAWGHSLQMIGRLRPGVSMDQARRETDTIARKPIAQFPRVAWAALKNGLIVHRLQDDLTAGVRSTMLAVLGAVILLLAIACVNVTSLLLGRGAQRRVEFAMRAALGAGRLRILRQLLTESLLLAAIGGAVGLLLADWGVAALTAIAPAGLPRANAIGLDARAFGVAAAITTLVGVAVGLLPALDLSRVDLRDRLQQGSRTTAVGQLWIRRGLVVTEVALALVLLVSAGLLMRSLDRLFSIDPGFNPSRVLTMQVQLSGPRFNDLTAADRFLTQALDAVRKVPGVRSAAFTSQLPLSGDDGEFGARFEGDNPNDAYPVFRYAVTPGYFETVGIPLHRGRSFDDHDTNASLHVVIISDAVAREKFSGQDPIGRRMRVGPATGPWFTIVGVVGDVQQLSLAAGDHWAVYLPAPQSWFVDRAMSLVARTSGDPAPAAPIVRDAIWSVDHQQPIVRTATLEGLVTATETQRRFARILFQAFGLAALILAAIGIYGILAAGVAERTREIGVRAALGASRADVLKLVLGQGLTLTTVGVVIGLAGCAGASRAIATLLFGVTRLDPATYALVVVLLGAVAAVACVVPARRAAHIDPALALRAE